MEAGELKGWITRLKETVLETFSDRLCFIGLQGSHARGEAGPDSDIDVVVILDHLTYLDLKKYEGLLDTLPARELVCGFLSGKEELAHWHRGDLFQFYHDTIPIYGDLNWLGSMLKRQDAVNAVKVGICNIYHMCVHNSIHEKEKEILKNLYKSARFVLQAKYYLESGEYIKTKAELLQRLTGRDKEMMQAVAEDLWNSDFDQGSACLLAWSSELICMEE